MGTYCESFKMDLKCIDIWNKKLWVPSDITIDDIRKGEDSGMKIIGKLGYSETAMYTEEFKKP